MEQVKVNIRNEILELQGNEQDLDAFILFIIRLGMKLNIGVYRK